MPTPYKPVLDWRLRVQSPDGPRMKAQSGKAVPDPVARAVLVALANYANGQTMRAFPSQRRLAADTGYSERTVRETLERAEHYGWLVRKVDRRVRRSATGAFPFTTYELTYPRAGQGF